jgi:putative PIN family toxin of toxin-antitoxin system
VRTVVDTNVLVGTMLGGQGDNAKVIRSCLKGVLSPLIGETLFLEYEDVLNRPELFIKSPLSRKERIELFAAFLSVCEWVEIYFSWRPNLRDEGDNHLVELAVAGGAEVIVTNNARDFKNTELRFPDLKVITPWELVKELR